MVLLNEKIFDLTFRRQVELLNHTSVKTDSTKKKECEMFPDFLPVILRIHGIHNFRVI